MATGTLEHPAPESSGLSDKIERTARGATAYCGGLGILSYYAAKICATGLLRLHHKPWRGDDAPCRALPGEFLTTVDDFLQRVLKIRREIHDQVAEEIDPEERLIYIGNHPTTNAVFMVLHYLQNRFSNTIGFITKRENLLNPLVGPPGLLSGCLAFINRNDTESAIASVRRACSTVLRPGTGLVYFPDAHRPKKRRIKEYREKWADKIPGLRDWLHHTCPPYSGGIHELLSGTAHVPRRVINVTAGLNRKDHTVFDIPNLVGATLHIEAQDVTHEIPTDEEDLRVWLAEEWKRKNELLGIWKGA